MDEAALDEFFAHAEDVLTDWGGSGGCYEHRPPWGCFHNRDSEH